MFKQLSLLNPGQISELKKIADDAQFVDGKISNPYSKVKNNLQLHDVAGYKKSSKILHDALMGNREFVDFAFPEKIAPPLITRYKPGMNYGLHADSAIIPLPDGPLRSDISCTIFLSDVNDCQGGALHVTQGEAGMELSLFSRDVIALAASVALSHATFDAAVFLGVCDKIVPGLVIAAQAFGHLPAVFLPAGPMTSGISNDAKAEVRQRFASGDATREELMASEMAA